MTQIQPKMDHMNFIPVVLQRDEEVLKQKEGTYKGSWKKRGGCGAFMMLARKWDRLENIVDAHEPQYDILKAGEQDMMELGQPFDREAPDGTLLAEIRDLRRYLVLVEAELMARCTEQHKNVYLARRDTTEGDGAEHPLQVVPPEKHRIIDPQEALKASQAVKGALENDRGVGTPPHSH